MSLLADLGLERTEFTIFEDNQSCIKSTQRWDHKRLKHIKLKYHFIKELVINKLVSVNYIPTKDQIADILTKNLIGEQFYKLRCNLGLIATL